ncbi:MAG TPA: tyrosine-type recombinase/integrase [Kofleriaceae bacterium]|jgi:site-specific recombinase XerD|nr:tyrosine-type recombinase/integrase [Kofleriaceae bacterium]
MPRSSRSTALLRVDRRGQYQLIDARRRPIAPANRFLSAVAVRGLSRATVRAYGFDLVVLYRWLAQRRYPLGSLSGRTLVQFIDAQRRDGMQPTTINRRLITARLLYRFCTGRELDGSRGALTPAPYFRGRGRDRRLGLHRMPRQRQLKLRVKVPRRIVEPLTATEVRHFLRTLRRYRDLAIVHLMLLCGLRSAEVLGVQLTDLLADDQQLRVRGKGNRERVLPLPVVVARSISDYVRWERRAERTGRLFVILQGPRRGAPMTLAGLRSLFRHRRRDYAVARANPHRFRHTFGADMARAGVRLPILQRLMGHADETTTLRYIELSMADIADEYRRAVDEIQRRYRGRSG